jgi:hypothetical protein
MPNLPPIAVLTCDTQEIQLPTNRVTLNSSASHDANARGVPRRIVSREYYKASGPGTVAFENQDDIKGTVEAVFPSLAGIYVLGVKVTDRGRLSNTTPAEVRVIVAPETIQEPKVKTIFGASGPSISNTMELENICGHPSISRAAISLEHYKGSGGLKEIDIYLDAGHTMYINVNEKSIKLDENGEKIPNPFPTDMEKYAEQIEPIFEHYAGSDVIMVCENEATTKTFHSGPMSDYLTMLETFVQIGTKYGLRCTDSSVHVLTVNESAFNEEKTKEVQELLDGFAKIPDMYAVNMHDSNGSKENYDSQDIVDAVRRIKEITGHNTVSNEWHTQNIDDNNVEVIHDMAKGWADAGVEFAVYLSGTTEKNKILNKGMTLTPIGKEYHDFINNRT